MQKKITLIFLLTFASLRLYSQVTDFYNVTWAIKQDSSFQYSYYNDKIVVQKDSIYISIRPNSNSSSWECKVINKSEKPATIKWSQAVMGSYNTSRVLFGDMRVFEISSAIQDAIVYPESNIEKTIISEYYARNSMITMGGLDTMKEIEKKFGTKGAHTVKIIIPVEQNGVITLYNMTLKGSYDGKKAKKK